MVGNNIFQFYVFDEQIIFKHESGESGIKKHLTFLFKNIGLNISNKLTEEIGNINNLIDKEISNVHKRSFEEDFTN